jgi:hypothetical protein
MAAPEDTDFKPGDPAWLVYPSDEFGGPPRQFKVVIVETYAGPYSGRCVIRHVEDCETASKGNEGNAPVHILRHRSDEATSKIEGAEGTGDSQARADRIMVGVDREGLGLPIDDYITMLEEVIRQCRDCVIAAREDQHRSQNQRVDA